MAMEPLEDEIKSAFAEVRYPGDDRLTVYAAAGRNDDDTFQLLRGRAWQDFNCKRFTSGDTPLADLTAEAFNYYMPALLMCALKETPDLSAALVFYFTPSTYEHLADQYKESAHYYQQMFEERMSLFSRAQRTVLANVFREFVARGWQDQADVSEAIDFLTESSAGPMC